LEELLAQSTRDVAMKTVILRVRSSDSDDKCAATERDGVRAATATTFFFCLSQNDKNGKLRRPIGLLRELDERSIRYHPPLHDGTWKNYSSRTRAVAAPRTTPPIDGARAATETTVDS
jgi:hypothetical protein